MARRWDSEQLGLLVLVPLLVLAPVVTGGITLLLVGFMLALSAASLPVQLGKDWIWMHCARIAASTLPLLVALVAVHFDDGRDRWLVWCVRHRGGAGHRRRADPFAADRQPGADGAADSRGSGARAMRGAGRRPSGRPR